MRHPLLLLIIVTLTSCNAVAQLVVPPTPVPVEPGLLVPQIISARPHDSNAFTQGLLLHNGSLYESTGLNGESTLREVNPQTGEVLRQIEIPEEYFAEGLALVDDRLIQLTWNTGVAFVYDLNTFEQVSTFNYETEGWGLCYDGVQLYMSDGTNTLYVRDAETFEIVNQIGVTYLDQPVTQINELECVGDSVYANIWLTDFIVEIDKATGQITSLINAADLLTPEERAAAQPGATLNGIAYDAATGNFLITGKLFPKLWEVELVPTGE